MHERPRRVGHDPQVQGAPDQGSRDPAEAPTDKTSLVSRSHRAQLVDCTAIGKQRAEMAKAGRPAPSGDRTDVTRFIRVTAPPSPTKKTLSYSLFRRHGRGGSLRSSAVHEIALPSRACACARP